MLMPTASNQAFMGIQRSSDSIADLSIVIFQVLKADAVLFTSFNIEQINHFFTGLKSSLSPCDQPKRTK